MHDKLLWKLLIYVQLSSETKQTTKRVTIKQTIRSSCFQKFRR